MINMLGYLMACACLPLCDHMLSTVSTCYHWSKDNDGESDQKKDASCSHAMYCVLPLDMYINAVLWWNVCCYLVNPCLMGNFCL